MNCSGEELELHMATQNEETIRALVTFEEARRHIQ
jgi:hypothetical protein